MYNEDEKKAIEIGLNVRDSITAKNHGIAEAYKLADVAQTSAMMMAEWKNEKFAEFLFSVQVQSNPVIVATMIQEKIEELWSSKNECSNDKETKEEKMKNNVNEEMSRKFCCFGCENYDCYTEKRKCNKFIALEKMAEWKDRQFELAMHVLMIRLDAIDRNADNIQFVEELKSIFNS